MKLHTKLNLHAAYNWSLKFDGRYSYVIANKNFQVLLENDRQWFIIKIDSGSEISIPASGSFSNDAIELTTSSKNFESSDFMQVTHTVKNKDTRSHTIDLGLDIDLQLKGSDIINFQNINPNKGTYASANNVNVTFLFRDSSPFVTDVDGYSPDGWWPNTKYANGLADYLYFCWKKRNINVGETKQFSYLVGTGDFIGISPKIETKYNIKNLLHLFNKIPCFCFISLPIVDIHQSIN